MTTPLGLPPITAPGSGRHSTYPQEPKKPHRRCVHCNRFLCWDGYHGKYVDHESFDAYSGGWGSTCP